jgi:hypothetical protein
MDVTLVNISITGLLAECSERLKPGRAVTISFEGTFEPRTVEARVARCAVSSMGKDGRLRYHVGISFAKPIRLDAVREVGAELDTRVGVGTSESKDAPRGKAESGRAADARKDGAHGVNDPATAGPGGNARGTAAPGVNDQGAGAPDNDIPRPVVRNRW